MERLKQRGGSRSVLLGSPPLDCPCWTGSLHGEAMGQGRNAFQSLLSVFFCLYFWKFSVIQNSLSEFEKPDISVVAVVKKTYYVAPCC